MIVITTVMVSVFQTHAATVTSTNDVLTTLQISQTANHRALFTTPSGVSEGQTITLTFSTSFNTASIIEDDVDIADDGIDFTTASSCAGTEQASVSMSSDVLTITICAGDGGAIAAASQILIEIGTNATSSGTGSNRITNPSSVGTYFVTIGGTFADFGSVALPIRNQDQTSVSAHVAVTSTGSGGGGSPAPTEPTTPPITDITAPTISGIVVSGVSATSATISWITNESSNSFVDYGLTQTFELGTLTDATLVANHSLTLSGLSEGMSYFFRARSADAAGNQATSSTQTFSTLDQTAPTISAIATANLTQSSATIDWSTDERATSVVEYGTNVSYGSTKSDTALVTGHRVILTGLTPNTQYHFRARSLDSSANSAVSADNVFTTLTDVPPANVTGLSVSAGNKQITLSWTNPLDSDLLGIRVLECADAFPSSHTDTIVCAQISNTLVTSLTRTGLSNNKTYYYGVFAYDVAGQFASGAVGSGTPTASEEEVPPVKPVPEAPFEEPIEVPSDKPAGQEGAPLIGGESEGETSGSQPGEPKSGSEPGSASFGSGPTLLGAGKVSLEREDVVIVVAGGNIVLSIGAGGSIDVLPETRMRLQVSEDELSDHVATVSASIGSDSYLLRRADEQGGNALYFADITAPREPQLYLMDMSVQYADGFKETVSSHLNVLPWGRVVGVIDGEETSLSGVKVTLSQVVDGVSVVWDGSPFNQNNPMTTGLTGTYGWYVPNGLYRLLASADKFESYTSSSYVVSNNVVNSSMVMNAILEKKPEVTNITEAVQQTAIAIATVFKSPVAQTVQEAMTTVRENEVIQQATDVATPTLAVTAGASVLVMSVAFDFIPFLQYLFTAPVLLFWRRKRKGFGVVYNAISRDPVDLCVVRLFLIEDETKPGPGRLVKSRVTDKGGRFFFLVQPGKYRLTAIKAGFRFPTDYLKDVKDDGTFLDVYHSEFIVVTEKDAVITPNIPLDPAQVGQTQTPKRVVWQGRLRVLQHLVAVSGVLVSLTVAIIRPSVLAVVMIAVQVLVYLLSRRLAKPRKPKSWGIVYDKTTKRPLGNVVARIFEPKYNKLLDTQVTDSKGRYAFLLGPSEYFAVFEKEGFKPTQVRPIDLRNAKGSQDFSVDVEMHPI
jgi:hypothetical protein